MSDPKRATIITVGAPKSAKNKVTKTVRLTISLDESNESKYPELNYKELVNVEEKQKTPKVTNGKAPDLDPFSDNDDDDVERAAKKFEQKYGGKSTYGRKGRSKHDEFADIGAGYDENDSFIDNTDGYDEMITPECDTLYGGFYINSGSLEFKTVPEDQLRHSDSEPAHRRNKRRISSSSSEESSESSSESSRDVKEKKLPNGDVPGHDTEHRKKKIKKLDKKAKRIRRNDSSAATSGKQTSDDNAHADGESADSRTSQSDSLASKPAPSSENAVTSDSSRDISEKDPLPAGARAAVEALKQRAARRQLADPRATEPGLLAAAEPCLLTLEKALSSFDSRVQKSAWTEVAKMFNTTRTKLCQKVALLATANTVPAPTPAVENNHKPPSDRDPLTPQEREAAIVDTLNKLKALIEEKTPAMMANYKVECERVQEERKKLEATAKEGGPHVERRMPKRRFPWCSASRALLARLSKLGGATLLAERALPLFPAGFARRPTLLRQADLKPDDVKRQRVNNTVSQPTPPAQPQPASLPVPPPLSQSTPKNPITTQPQPKTAAPPQPVPKPVPPQTAPKSIPTQPAPKAQTPTFSEPIQFPSSLTVTTTVKTSPDKSETIVIVGDDKKESQLKIPNSVTITKEEEKNEKYVPPNSIGSITITPVTNQKKTEKPKDGLIRVKTPAVLMKEANDIAKKDKDRHKVQKEKRVNSPLHIETNFQSKDKISPVSRKEIEDKIPRPGLIPVHLSPTFAKPTHPADKRPDVKKKKDILIVSDVDPLSDINSEPVAVDDSSSDVEVIEEKEREEKVPEEPQKMEVEVGAEVDTDIDAVMRNLREMQDSQEPNFTSSSFGSVIKSDRNSLNKMDGCSAVTG